MKRRTKKHIKEVSKKSGNLTIKGWLTFHAGIVIRAIDVALKTETNAVSRCHLTHSRRYLTEFEQRHPDGVVPWLMNKNEFGVTYNVLTILKLCGVSLPKNSFQSEN